MKPIPRRFIAEAGIMTFLRLLLVTPLAGWLIAGCAAPADYGIEREYPGKTVSTTAAARGKATENVIDEYFRESYEKIDTDSLTSDERELLYDEAFFQTDFKELTLELGGFVGEKLPYVNLDRPTSKDVAFLLRYGDAIYCYREYLAINMNNLSPDESDAIREFRKSHPSGRINPAGFTGWQAAALESLRIFVDFENMSDRDVVLFHRIGMPLAKTPPGEAVWVP